MENKLFRGFLNFRSFIKQSLMGGLLVVLPAVLLIFVFRWVFFVVTDLIQPLTDFVLKNLFLPEIVADIIVLGTIMVGCFFIGVTVSTTVGRWLHHRFDKHLIRLAPGYKMVKEVIVELLGDSKNSPFSNGMVAKARIFGADSKTEVTGLVTCEHANGDYTVFVPTGPNPTSGNMYHLPPEQVTLYPDVPVESMMKTIIGCGAGTDDLFNQPKK